jgi:hypothetical protein
MTALARTTSRLMAAPWLNLKWLLPLMFAGNLAVASLAWVIVGSLMN